MGSVLLIVGTRYISLCPTRLGALDGLLSLSLTHPLQSQSESNWQWLYPFPPPPPPLIPTSRAIRQLDSDSDQDTLRHDSATIEHWRKALSIVAEISGFELEACNGDQGELLEKVVESVLRKVKKTPMNVAKYPTGLGEKVRDFENKILSLRQQSGRKPQVAGIVGLGGVGKTTLAKQLFNKKRSYYNRDCFLDDVRENVGKGNLTLLQSKLLQSLIGSCLLIDNKDEAIEMLRKHLSSHRILLVLDDVDTVDQVDELVPDRTCIHSDSLIVITSRDKDVITRSGVEDSLIYKLDGLNELHSLELFCQHAFGRPDPLPRFENLAQQFVNACHGLPLSLKVFGALLHGNNDLSYWSAQLVQLERILPAEIQKRLQISYNTLNEVEKQVFLDIACFFIGQDRDMAISIWKVSNWGGSLAFQNLQNKCLVGVDAGNMIHMHDHLKDLGICEASVSQPLRFWHCHDLLQQSMEKTVRGINVRGIRIVRSEYHDDDEFDGIQLRRLHLVDTEGSLLERILKSAKFPNLIWLRWRKCPYSSLPPLIPMEKLMFLEVSGDTLETLWQQESQLPVRLEELRVNGCVQLNNIWGLPQMTKLHRLDVSGCAQLQELPSMETLVSLETLRVVGCANLKIIQGLEHATKLRLLNVSGCSRLDELPSMTLLTSLVWLWADGCEKLKSIPGLEHATKLRGLDVSRCCQLDELPSMELWTSLEVLCARGCPKLKSIRGLEHATKLRGLNVHGCSELHELPNMETMVSLEMLWASACRKLKSIQGLEHATKLRMLNVRGCSELHELPNMETMVSLEMLLADGCVKLKSIRGLLHCTRLQTLHVYECYELEQVEYIEHCTWLRELDMSRCPKLQRPSLGVVDQPRRRL